MTKFHHSGNHGGKPLWMFVTPTRTTLQEDQHLYLTDPEKRWDSLAFHMAFTQIEQLKQLCTKPIPNGKGGTSWDATAADGAPIKVVAALKQQAATAIANEQLAMQREMHALKCNELQQKTSAVATNAILLLMNRIRDHVVLQNEFRTLGQKDMVDGFEVQLVQLKQQLQALNGASIASSSSTASLDPACSLQASSASAGHT